MNFRIGYGYDVHRLAEGETLWLGGVLVPHSKGTVAHSDGDVLLHAVTDALLGAVAAGDIGTFFPPSDERWKNADFLSSGADVGSGASESDSDSGGDD